MKDDNDEEDDSDAFFDAKMNAISVESMKHHFIRIWLNRVEYLEEDLILEEYLEMLERLDEIDDQ